MLESVIILLTLLLDQGSKLIVMTELAPHNGGVLPLWQGVFHFSYVENRGAAFGTMEGMQWLFLIVTPIVIGVLIYYLIKHRSAPKLLRIALALLLSGALGNYIDRLLLGYVRDFMHIALINFAVFNIADSCVTVGAALFAWQIIFRMDKPAGKDADGKKGVYLSSPRMRMLRRVRLPRITAANHEQH